MERQPSGVVLFSLIVVFNMVVWMAMIAGIGMGAMHFGGCPVQPYIPVYLIVLGASTIFSLSVTYLHCSRQEGASGIWTKAPIALLYLFNFCWFMSGTVWIYAIYPPSYKTDEKRYCQKTLYRFAFFFTSLCWLLVFVMFFYGGCFLIMTCRRIRLQMKYNSGFTHEQTTSYGATSDNTEAQGQ